MDSEEHLNLTIEERILLHLLDFHHYSKEITVPLEVTQQGISEATLIQRKHVPRSLKAMMNKGFLEETIRHVTGKRQRLRAYFLTDKGRDQALLLKDHVKSILICVCTEEGSTTLTVEEAMHLLKGICSWGKVLSYMTMYGVVERKKIDKKSYQMDSPPLSDNALVYKKALAQAWKDGTMTSDERELLKNLRESLHISEKDHVQFEEDILKDLGDTADDKALAVYKVALEQALADHKITPDERAILEKIKRRFHLKNV